ncbi:hypothetical protein D3C75_950830 [compost metagenome]
MLHLSEGPAAPEASAPPSEPSAAPPSFPASRFCTASTAGYIWAEMTFTVSEAVLCRAVEYKDICTMKIRNRTKSKNIGRTIAASTTMLPSHPGLLRFRNLCFTLFHLPANKKNLPEQPGSIICPAHHRKDRRRNPAASLLPAKTITA